MAQAQYSQNKFFTVDQFYRGRSENQTETKKFFHLIYSYGGIIVCYSFLIAYNDANGLQGAINIDEGYCFEPQPPKLVIVCALYGSASVTDKIQVFIIPLSIMFFTLGNENENENENEK